MRALFLLVTCSVHLVACQTNSQPEKKNLEAVRQENKFQIPFADTLSSNWIVVKSTVYNKPAFLVVDNGTTPQQQLILFKHYAAAKGIVDTTVLFAKEMTRIENLPAAISIQGFSDTLNAEILQVHYAPVHKMPDGILGKGFLTRHMLMVDYNNRKLQIMDSADVTMLEGYKVIEMKPLGVFYTFSAELFIQGKQYKENLFLDLGNSQDGFLFGLKFYQRNKDKLKIDARQTQESFALFSKSKVAALLVDSLVINGTVIRNIPSGIETSSSATYIPLLVGNSVLRHFGKVIFDLRHNKIYFREIR
jgi:hypothetical protein